MSFGERLRNARMAAGLTQQQLERRIGLAPTHVSQYERGHREPSLENLRKICRALSVSADELVGVDGKLSRP